MGRPDKLDLDEVRTETQKYIQELRAKAHIHQTLHEVLKKYQGKVISRRVATALKQALDAQGHDAFSVYWKADYGWVSIVVWGKGVVSYNNRYEGMIAYDNDPYPTNDRRFDYDHWVARYAKSQGSELYSVRADQAEAALRFIAQRVSAYNAAVVAVSSAWADLEGLATWNS